MLLVCDLAAGCGMRVVHTNLKSSVFRSRLRVGSGKLSPATLAVLTGAPDAAMGADGGAPAVLADAPDAVMRADARAPAVLAAAPLAVMRADGGAPAVLAPAPLAVMLADARAPAVLAILASERERERETGREIFKSVGKGLGGMASKRKGVFNANARSCHK